jgi:hypothetical protein
LTFCLPAVIVITRRKGVPMNIMEMMGISVTYVCMECGFTENLATPEKPNCDCSKKEDSND